MAISNDQPFRLHDDMIDAGRVDLTQSEMIRHEVLYEREVASLHDRDVYVNRGISSKRMALMFFVSIAALSCLLFRAGWMQIVRAEMYKQRSDDNRFRVQSIPSRRGIIRDRNGNVLAENIPSFDVQMRWVDLPADETDRNDAISTVARAIGITSGDILSALNATGTAIDEWTDVAKDISYDRAIDVSIRLPDLSGVALITTAKRTYPHSNEIASLSHVLGYVGSISPEEYETKKNEGYRRTDEIGKTGVESSYESVIRGVAGERTVEVDAFGRPRSIIEERDPTDGRDVSLTIDLDLQKATEEALKKGLELAKVARGSAIVMDVRTGEILSIVSLPAYDDNIFTGKVSSTAYSALLEDENRPLFARAWSGQFPSGSVIKPLIASAALQEGIITPNTTVSSIGGIWVGPWFFPDWQAGGHGLTNVRKAIAWSVNTFFYYIGGGYDTFRGLGVAKLSEWMTRFGLGSASGLDLPGEASGNVPNEAWKEEVKGERWYIGDTYNLSIGQGDLLVTPLQIARVTSAVANGGTLVLPHVAGRSSADASSLASAPKLDINPDALKTVREGMHETVLYGSGRRLLGLPFSSAGKTGTAQWRSDRPTHAWYTGFAPYDHPEVAVTVLIEEGGEGSSFATPVAFDILKAWWNIFHED